jgi:hypothetical protein
MAKSSILLLAVLAATASAFNAPLLATRAVGKPAPVKKAAPVKKVVAKPTGTKVVVKKAAPVKKVVLKPVAKKVVAKPVVKKVAAKPVVKKVAAKAAPAKKSWFGAKPAVAAKAAPAKKVVAKKPVAKKVVAKPVAKAAPVKKVVAKKPVAKAAPGKKVVTPSKFGKPKFEFKVRMAPPKPKFQVKAPPASRVKKAGLFVFDDGLTEIERTQRATIPAFLSGSAKPSKVKSDIRPDLYATGDEYFFSPYDTTVATVTLFLIVSLIVKAGSS